MELDTDLVGETLVETAEQCATTGEVDTVLHDVGIKFRRGLFECTENGSLNLRD